MRVPAEVFTFREMAGATEKFNPELLVGEGGFGRVYKGFLKKTNQVHYMAFYDLYLAKLVLLHY